MRRKKYFQELALKSDFTRPQTGHGIHPLKQICLLHLKRSLVTCWWVSLQGVTSSQVHPGRCWREQATSTGCVTWPGTSTHRGHEQNVRQRIEWVAGERARGEHKHAWYQQGQLQSGTAPENNGLWLGPSPGHILSPCHPNTRSRSWSTVSTWGFSLFTLLVI